MEWRQWETERYLREMPPMCLRKIPLIPELTARDNYKLWFKGDKAELERDLEEGVGKFLGLTEFLGTPAGKLSGGQKKRLSIASALSNQASLLIMDEPGAALDLEAKEEILTYIRNYLKNGGTVILTSHETQELSICTQLFVMKKGSAHAGDGETVGCGAGFTFLNLKIIDKILQYLY